MVFSLLLIAFGAGYYFYWVAGPAFRARTLETPIATVDYGNIEVASVGIGNDWPREITPIEARVSGRLAELHVNVGDVVEASRLLALIDVGNALPPGERVEMLASYELEAPFAGTVVSIDLQPGATIVADATQPVAVMGIADLTRLAVETQFDGMATAYLREGIDVQIGSRVGGVRRWPAKLIELRPMPAGADEPIVLQARIEVDNDAGDLLPGMTVQVFFATIIAENVLTLPLSALAFDEIRSGVDRATVQFLLPNGLTEMREVVVGARNGVRAEVVSGLEAGDRVVVWLQALDGHTAQAYSVEQA